MPCPLKEAARLAPRLPAFDKTTFQELDELADKMARALEASGIGPGDRIAFLHRPTCETAALFFAAWRIGASICPLSLRLPASQIETLLARLDARCFIDSFSPKSMRHWGPLFSPKSMRHWGPLFSPKSMRLRGPLSFLPFSPLSPRLRMNRYPPLSFPAALLFTSGSTALPKIAVLSLSNLLSNAAPLAKWLGLRIGDRWLLNLPLYHVGGIGILIRSTLALATVVLDEKDPEITHISAVPAQLYRKSPVYKNLRCLLIGGAPISSFPEHLPCYLSYGLTEMGSLVTVGAKSFFPQPQSRCDFGVPLGFPLPERELRLSPTGAPKDASSLGKGKIGEILVRGKCLFEGYWEEGRISKPFDQDSWFATGDLGRMSDDGLTVLGRIDWQFISGGENIQPEEIEQQLLLLPDVFEAAVVPVDDPEFGKRPLAVLVASTRAKDPAYLKSALLEHLPKFKIPIRFLFINDELPKNGHKINRKAIAEIVSKNI